MVAPARGLTASDKAAVADVVGALWLHRALRGRPATVAGGGDRPTTGHRRKRENRANRGVSDPPPVVDSTAAPAERYEASSAFVAWQWWPGGVVDGGREGQRDREGEAGQTS